eukprot:c19224_g1_i1.p1 GENE.c19224_g1_i1~~c19224_g1_i1.p1  ORF type:complete len:384 (-),score=30.71 c19224_g1_i1:732-1853(-)
MAATKKGQQSKESVVEPMKRGSEEELRKCEYCFVLHSGHAGAHYRKHEDIDLCDTCYYAAFEEDSNYGDFTCCLCSKLIKKQKEIRRAWPLSTAYCCTDCASRQVYPELFRVRTGTELPPASADDDAPVIIFARKRKFSECEDFELVEVLRFNIVPGEVFKIERNDEFATIFTKPTGNLNTFTEKLCFNVSTNNLLRIERNDETAIVYIKRNKVIEQADEDEPPPKKRVKRQASFACNDDSELFENLQQGIELLQASVRRHAMFVKEMGEVVDTIKLPRDLPPHPAFSRARAVNSAAAENSMAVFLGMINGSEDKRVDEYAKCEAYIGELKRLVSMDSYRHFKKEANAACTTAKRNLQAALNKLERIKLHCVF